MNKLWKILSSNPKKLNCSGGSLAVFLQTNLYNPCRIVSNSSTSCLSSPVQIFRPETSPSISGFFLVCQYFFSHKQNFFTFLENLFFFFAFSKHQQHKIAFRHHRSNFFHFQKRARFSTKHSNEKLERANKYVTFHFFFYVIVSSGASRQNILFFREHFFFCFSSAEKWKKSFYFLAQKWFSLFSKYLVARLDVDF